MSSDQDHRTETDGVPVPGKKKRPVTDESGRRRNAARKARKLAEKKAESMPVVAPIDAPRQVRVVDAPLTTPTPPSGIIGVLQQPYVVKLLVRRQIAQMYSGSLLGLFWSYIQPATRFGIYYAVFGILLG
ncbi:MAG: type transporter, partial [Nocardioidaceae bacterium]|nr:type transporter [Nocardioidaceae bacterium]